MEHPMKQSKFVKNLGLVYKDLIKIKIELDYLSKKQNKLSFIVFSLIVIFFSNASKMRLNAF
jgi:hypothetical protein